MGMLRECLVFGLIVSGLFCGRGVIGGVFCVFVLYWTLQRGCQRASASARLHGLSSTSHRRPNTSGIHPLRPLRHFFASCFPDCTALTHSSAIHVHSGTRVAIKRISPFNHAMFSQRTLREIKLLRHFQ